MSDQIYTSYEDAVRDGAIVDHGHGKISIAGEERAYLTSDIQLPLGLYSAALEILNFNLLQRFETP